MSTFPAELRAQLLKRWAALAPREQALLALMGGALVLLVVWLIAIRPAWHLLDQAPARRAQVDAQLLELQTLAAEAKQLRAMPAVPSQQAGQVLKSATDRLGERGKATLQGDRATLTLTGASGEDLRQWLVEVRGGARARPIEASLTRAGTGYNGTLIVALGGPQ